MRYELDPDPHRRASVAMVQAGAPFTAFVSAALEAAVRELERTRG